MCRAKGGMPLLVANAGLGFVGAGGCDEKAHGIVALGTMTMARAIKQITVERDLDRLTRRRRNRSELVSVNVSLTVVDRSCQNSAAFSEL